MDKKQFIDNMIDTVRSLNIASVVGSRIDLIDRRAHSEAICPFHPDRKLGSFIVTPHKRIFKCFSCGVGGDAIKFVAEYEGLNYLEAAFKVALEFGVITNSEHEEYFGRRRWKKDFVDRVERRYLDMDKKRFENNIGEPELLDQVFRLFIDLFPLKDAHRSYLEKERGLSEKEISQGLYFSVPDRRGMTRFSAHLRKAFPDKGDDILEQIPGFYKKTYDRLWTYVSYKGIGIGIQNADGQVVGIQVRRDEKKDHFSSRYVWFSSAFAMHEEEKYEYGTSSGSPVDVLYPDKITNRTVLITEGRFKAQALAKKTGSVCVSVQGVSSWRGIIKELKRIPNSTLMKERYEGTFKTYCLLVAFDADIHYKVQVFDQLKKMTDQLEKNGYPVYYLSWDEEKGKGIDDVILANQMDGVKRYEKADYDKQYLHMLDKVLEDNKIEKMTDLKEQMVKEGFAKYMKIKPLARNRRSENHKRMMSA